MRLIHSLALTLLVLLWNDGALAKKPTRPNLAANRPDRGSMATSTSSGKRPPVSRRRVDYEDAEEDSFEADPFEPFVDEDEDDDEMEEVVARPPVKAKRPAPPRGAQPPTQSAPRKERREPPNRRRPPVERYDDERDFEEEEDDYVPPRRDSNRPLPRGSPNRRGPPPRGANGRTANGRRPPGGGRVVPYAKPGHGAAAVFTKGWSAVVGALPDPALVKEAAISGINAAKQTTSSLSANIYREVKGLTSSELEQVLLKATRPDETAVKGKHVERLVALTYQISPRQDIYGSVLRKLWSKMAEKDWRTTIKALYILHRYSADASPEHAPSLKARLREMRRTRDPKRKDKYFNTKQLVAGESSPENIKFRAFMSRYAHYVLLRAQCFGGMFDEISSVPKPDKRTALVKPITSTSLRSEHFDAAKSLLKAGVVCQLKDGEECENTAIACERVVSDMIGLTAAVAMALNRALKSDDLKGADPALLKKWCAFYKDELLPQTKTMVKKTSPKLDAYGLFLPSRMGTSVSPDLLQKGLSLQDIVPEEETTDTLENADDTRTAPVDVETVEKADPLEPVETEKQAASPAAVKSDIAVGQGADPVDDEEEYEYEEEEYYDEEEG
jgi:ANTH domain